MKTCVITSIIILIVSVGVKAQPILDQNNIGVSTTRSLVDNLQNCLQTFIPQISGELNEVKIDIETESCPYPLICKVYEGELGSNLLATELVSVPIYTPRGMQSIIFSTPPNLISGQTYTLALYANCISSPGNSMWWYKSVDGAYGFGQAYNQWGTTIQAEDTLNDFYFQTYMTAIWNVEEMENDELSIYPVPTDKHLTIHLSSNEPASFFVTDAYGRVLMEDQFSAKYILNVEELNNGVYFLRVNQGTRMISRRVLINRS